MNSKKILMIFIVIFIILIISIVAILYNLRLITIPLFSSRPYIFLSKLGSRVEGESYFKTPNDLSIDSKGNIYVTDSSNRSILKFSPQGKFIVKWNATFKWETIDSCPKGIAVNSNNDIYIANVIKDNVKKFDSQGQFIMELSLSEIYNINYFDAITIDTQDNIYITDVKKIHIFNYDDIFIKTWDWEDIIGSFDEIKEITNITISSTGYVYAVVTTSDETRTLYSTIYVFNKSGELISKWGEKCKKNGESYIVGGITTDLEDNILLADYTNNQIDIYNPKGNLITSFGSKGSNDGQFLFPKGITVDSEGNLYVVDSGNYRIQKFAPTP